MNNKIFTYLLIAFLLVFVGTGAFMFFSNRQTNNTLTKEQVSPTLSEEKAAPPKFEMTEGEMKLVSEKQSYTKGEKVTVNIEADSGDKSVVGYDTIFIYDPLAFEFVSANSSISDYKVYSYKKESYLTLTAVKNLSSAPSPLKSRIATLVFTATKSGKYNFSLKSSMGSEKTDMVTEKTEVLSPALNSITVQIN